MEFRYQENTIHILVQADRAETRDLLQEQLVQMRAALDELGIKVGDFTVSLGVAPERNGAPLDRGTSGARGMGAPAMGDDDAAGVTDRVIYASTHLVDVLV